MGVVILVRHGQASFGSADYDRLSPLGRRQADLVGRRLAAGAAPVRTLVAGTQARQRSTAQVIAAACGATVRTDGRWDEYDHVGLTGAQSAALVFEHETARAQADAVLDDAVRRWVAGADTASGIESHETFLARGRAALRSVVGHRGTTVVATSAGVIAALAADLLGLPGAAWPGLARIAVNTGITKIVVGRQGLSLVCFNDHAHLEHDRELLTYR